MFLFFLLLKPLCMPRLIPLLPKLSLRQRLSTNSPQSGIPTLAETSIGTQTLPIDIILEPVRFPQQVDITVPSPSALYSFEDALESAPAGIHVESFQQDGRGMDAHYPHGPGQPGWPTLSDEREQIRWRVESTTPVVVAPCAASGMSIVRRTGGNIGRYAHEVQQHEE